MSNLVVVFSFTIIALVLHAYDINFEQKLELDYRPFHFVLFSHDLCNNMIDIYLDHYQNQ
jgi:hypothetical protein